MAPGGLLGRPSAVCIIHGHAAGATVGGNVFPLGCVVLGMLRSAVLLTTLMAVLAAEPGPFSEMARNGQWEQLLASASSRREQLPLSPHEALIAAEAARHRHNVPAQRGFLVTASDDTGLLGAVARLELAALPGTEPQTVAELVRTVLSHRHLPRRLQRSAVRLGAEAVLAGIGDNQRAGLDSTLRTLKRWDQRPLEAALAATADPVQERRLQRLLVRSLSDEAAFTAASALVELPRQPTESRWRVANTLFIHGDWGRAAQELEELAELEWSKRSSAAFLRGRCDYRRERWAPAATWYEQARAEADDADEQARILGHQARALELDGDLEGAIAAVGAALNLDSDDRYRLHLLRLLLLHEPGADHTGGPDPVSSLVSQIEGSEPRARAELLLALAALRRGAADDAMQRLTGISQHEWQLPARVVAAQVAQAAGSDATAAQLLTVTCDAPQVERYWLGAARRVLERVSDPAVARWRTHCAGSAVRQSGSARFAAVARWAAAEPDPVRRDRLQALVADIDDWQPVLSPPSFPGQIAGALWQLGLVELAAKWDPDGFPHHDSSTSAWSAGELIRGGASGAAMLAVDRIWKAAGGGPDGDQELLPAHLRRGLYPLPWPQQVERAATAAGIDPALLAAVVRAESRWDRYATSAVGARGLAQLMPSTAAQVATRIGIDPPSLQALYESQVALNLGAHELAFLVQRFGGRLAPAVAAYNAGPEQAASWLRQCGAGWTEEQFLLTVTFSATRRYLEHVLSARQVYAQLYPQLGGARAGNGAVGDFSR